MTTTIAERIHNGESAASIGISSVEYDNRKTIIESFLRTWSGNDFDTDYRTWVKSQADGERGNETPVVSQKKTGLRIRRVTKRKPCPSCGGGKIR